MPTREPVVWHLSSNRWNSAITEYFLAAPRALAGRGWANVVSPLAGSPAEARARALGLAVASLPRFSWREAGLLRAMQREIRPDLVVAYNGPETFLLRFLAPGPTRVRFRGQDIPPLGPLARRWHEASASHLAAFLTPSAAMGDKLRAQTRLPVHAVTLGCPTEAFRRGDAAPARGERPSLLIFGRFDPVKGHAAFMRVFRDVLAHWDETQAPRPQLRIVGEAANVSVADLEAAARELGLRWGDDVEVTAARVADVPALLRATTLGVVSSLGSEVICRVAEEFLLCGTPVLVSGVGSLEDVLFAEGAGASYKGLDPAAAARVVGRWVARSWAEGEDAKRARAEAANRHFSLAAMGLGLEAALGRAFTVLPGD